MKFGLIILLFLVACGSESTVDIQTRTPVSFVTSSLQSNQEPGSIRALREEPREFPIVNLRSGNHLMNLSYQGLKVIDLSNPSTPRVVASLRLAGEPAAIHHVGDHLYLFFDHWAQTRLGRIIVVDISTPSSPLVTHSEEVPGIVSGAWVTNHAGEDFLYMGVGISDGDDSWVGVVEPPRVRSFRLGAGTLEEVSSIELGNHTSIFRRSEDHILVGQNQEVAVFDTSNPDGTLGAGIWTSITGSMDLGFYQDKLWVATQSRDPRLATFRLTQDRLVPLDSTDLTEGYITHVEARDDRLYLGTDSATRAFEIQADGKLTSRVLSVPGRVLFMKSMETQFLLISKGETMKVTLLDVSDFDNPLELAAVTLEAENWDPRSFSLAMDAITSSEVESNLIMMPFTSDVHASQIKLVTFSASTLKVGGVIDLGQARATIGDPKVDMWVREALSIDPLSSTLAAISGADLSLYDLSQADSPEPLAGLDLMPAYTDILHFGEYGVRRRSRQNTYWWNPSRDEGDSTDALEIFNASEDPNLAPTLATIPLPIDARLRRANNRLIVIMEGAKIAVWDLTLPTMPYLVDTRTYRSFPELPYVEAQWDWDRWTCNFECYRDWAGVRSWVVGDVLVLANSIQSLWLTFRFIDVGGDTLEMSHVDVGRDGDFAGLVVEEPDKVWVSYSRPTTVEDQAREYSAFFMREIDLTLPNQPELGPELSIPGYLLQVRDERLLTMNVHYKSQVGSELEFSLNLLGLGETTLIESQVFAKGFSTRLAQDLVFVSEPRALTLLRSSENGLQKLSRKHHQGDMILKAATQDRVMFQAPGGMLVMNAEDPEAVVDHDFFPMGGWQSSPVIDGQFVWIAEGPYGLGRFNLY